MWVRGLKQRTTGVRINKRSVAPHVGAWIETKKSEVTSDDDLSHPMWVRGLKLYIVTLTNRL